MAYWINSQGQFYDGDCAIGDRTATDAEISTWKYALDNPLTLLDLVAAKKQAMADVIAFADSITAQVTSLYPEAERSSWAAQLAEARLILAGQVPPDPSIVAGLATAQNISVAALANAVIAKATKFQQIEIAVQTIRTIAQTAINSVTSPAQMPGVIDALRAQAIAAANSLGLSA